jgi:hypothetical protein
MLKSTISVLIISKN